MWRLCHLAFRSVSAAQFWIERRFTRAGMLVGGVLVAGAALGVDTNQTVAYKLFALALALLAVGVISAAFLRGRFAVQRFLPRTATAGEAFSYRVAVTNLGARIRDGLSLIEDLADPRPGFAEFHARLRFPTYHGWKRLIEARRNIRVDEQALPRLAPGATVEVTVRGRAFHRGSQHFAGISIARVDPLALVKATFRIDRRANMVILPRRYALPPIALPGSRIYQPGGVALASSIGDSEEFMGLRDYRPGDPLQRIHWKSFARVGNPVVKEYQDEFFERHALVLDTFATAENVAAFEEAVSIAASFGCAVNTQECLLDLMFIGAQSYCYTAGRGQFTAGHLLEVLAGVQPCRDKPFLALENAVLARCTALTGCICLLLAWDEPRIAFTRRLRALGIPLLVLAVTATPPSDRPSWLRVLVPGRVQEGLARL